MPSQVVRKGGESSSVIKEKGNANRIPIPYSSVSEPMGPVPLAGPTSILNGTKSLFKLTFFKKVTVHIQNSGTKKTFNFASTGPSLLKVENHCLTGS